MFIVFMILLDIESLKLEDIKFIITVLSILSAFSHRYEDEKAQEVCFILIIIDILLFFYLRFVLYKDLSIISHFKGSENSKTIILVINAFILYSIIYFLYGYISMPLNYRKKKYSESSEEIFMLYNKSINYHLNDREKIKIKKFCKSEIDRLKLLSIYKHKFLQSIFKKKYDLILQEINMYIEIEEKLYINYNI